MNNKKIGVVILIISILLGVIFITIIKSLFEKSAEIDCFKDKKCRPIESSLSLTHFAFGIMGFIFALGIYLIIFAKGDEDILNRLEEQKNKEINKEKFVILLKGLDSFEKKVLKAIREQSGITQNTLTLRTNLSKAKVSQVLVGLEKKDLIKREKKGKTYALYFREAY